MRPVDVQPGDRYGVMTVVAEAPRGRSGTRWQRRVLVSCDCGAQVTRELNSLRSGHDRACSTQCPLNPSGGWFAAPVPVAPGDRFGPMTVVQATRMVTGGRAVRAVIVDCDCGRRGVLRRLSTLREGHARGCSPQCPVPRRSRRPPSLA